MNMIAKYDTEVIHWLKLDLILIQSVIKTCQLDVNTTKTKLKIKVTLHTGAPSITPGSQNKSSKNIK